MSAYEGSKQQERDEDYARGNKVHPKMFGGNKNVYNDSEPSPWVPTEQPLTHHQQAVKDFMIAIVSAGKIIDRDIALERAVDYADAFINQINKK